MMHLRLGMLEDNREFCDGNIELKGVFILDCVGTVYVSKGLLLSHNIHVPDET